MAISDCTLTADDLSAQIGRYRRLGASAITVEQDDRRLVITFGSALDRALLEQTIAVERRCCSFFTLAYDASQRRLTIGVDDPGRVVALDALRAAITGQTHSGAMKTALMPQSPRPPVAPEGFTIGRRDTAP